jgi:hypothetical protein
MLAAVRDATCFEMRFGLKLKPLRRQGQPAGMQVVADQAGRLPGYHATREAAARSCYAACW